MKKTSAIFKPGGAVVNKFSKPSSEQSGGQGAEVSKELTDEIRAFRDKQKEFDATNDHQTYAIVVFSTKEDKKTFLAECGLNPEHTLINGYEMAIKLNKQPHKPAFKLKPPF